MARLERLSWLFLLTATVLTRSAAFVPRSHLPKIPSQLPRRHPSLHMTQPNDQTNKSSTEDDKLRDGEFRQRTKRWVVLVDDEEAIRMAVGDFLYDSGYQVTACADADALLQVVSPTSTTNENNNLNQNKPNKLPDVIVSDVRMPGKDGIELVGLIRADERLSRVPIILLTAKALTEDRIAGYQAGADVYLPKPFNPEELLSIIDNAILRREQMAGDRGRLVELQEEMSNIKQLLRQNGNKVVKATDVYLTPAERQVLELLSKGYTNREIAAERGVSVSGINRMIQKMYLSTQTQTRTELVRWAIETGYVARR